MDGSETVCWFAIVLCMLGMIGGVVLICEDAVNHPAAAQNALEYCQAQGANSYMSFERIPFSQQPLGIRCEYPEENIDIKGAYPVKEVSK